MSAGIYNIEIEQYATLNLQMVWEDASGNPISLVGYTADLDVKDSSGLLVVALTTSNSGIVLGGVLGTITLALSAAATAALPPGNFVYDLLLTDGSGNKTRLIEG